MATRQAVFAGMPELTIGLNSTEIIKICVTPPPKFPQPAAVALAVPTTFGENIKEHQNWLVTKVAPAGFVLRKIHSNRIFDNGLWVLEKLLFGSRLAAGGGGGWWPMGVDRWHAHPPNIGKELEQVISVSIEHIRNESSWNKLYTLSMVCTTPWHDDICSQSWSV